MGTLEAIKKDHQDSDECFIRLLTTWLRRKDPPPTRKALADVLESPVIGIPVDLKGIGLHCSSHHHSFHLHIYMHTLYRFVTCHNLFINGRGTQYTMTYIIHTATHTTLMYTTVYNFMLFNHR